MMKERDCAATVRAAGKRIRPLSRWAPLLITLSAACTSTPVEPAVLEDGKSLWRRVETDHFVVESNLPSDSALLRTASEFEVLWHAFASVPVLGLRPPSEKPIVVVLQDSSEYRYVAGEQSAAAFVDDTALGPLILLPPHSGAFRETVIKHELAHFVGSATLKDSPRWLNEGLAQVMETADYDADEGKILFGRHSPALVQNASFKLPAYLFMGPWPKTPGNIELRRYYGRSWLLVHYLIDDELQGFLNFIVRIRNGEEWQTAWEREILLRRDAIDDALDRYYERAKYGLWTVRAHVPDMNELHAAAVTPADALALRFVLRTCGQNPARERAQDLQAADADLRAARDLDPESARVRRILEALEAAKTAGATKSLSVMRSSSGS
jgi:hypothetical protein